LIGDVKVWDIAYRLDFLALSVAVGMIDVSAQAYTTSKTELLI